MINKDIYLRMAQNEDERNKPVKFIPIGSKTKLDFTIWLSLERTSFEIVLAMESLTSPM